MKFLLDLRAASRSLQQLLADLGHDVLTGKDFGELVFVLRQPHPCIVRECKS